MVNPSRRLPLLLAVLVVATVLVACQNTPPTAPTDVTVDLADGFIGYTTGTCDRALHLKLQDWHEVPDGTLWRHFSATLDCSTGDTFLIAPPGWGEGREIGITVPAGAVPTSYPGYPHVVFTLAIPEPGIHLPLGGDPEPWTAIPFHFYPHIDFLAPVGVQLAWPEWAEDPTGTGFDLVNIEAEEHEDSEHYRVERVSNAFYAVDGDPAPPAPIPWTDGISFAVDHFSRWTLVNGDDGDKGVLDNLGVGETDHCWDDLPPDLERPLEILR